MLPDQYEALCAWIMYDAVNANDAEVAWVANDDELACNAYDEVSGTLDAYDAVKAYDALIAFCTYEAVAAFIMLPDQYDAVATDIDDVWFESITFESFTVNDPVIEVEPVIWCVFDNKEPLIEDPVTKSIDDVIVCTFIVCAVNVPLTVKLSAEDAVSANDELIAFKTYDADTAFKIYEAVAAFIILPDQYEALAAFMIDPDQYDAVEANDALNAVNEVILVIVTIFVFSAEPVIWGECILIVYL